MAEFLGQLLDVHGDDRFVLDYQHVGFEFALDLQLRVGGQFLGIVLRNIEYRADIGKREPFDRRQQQRLAREHA